MVMLMIMVLANGWGSDCDRGSIKDGYEYQQHGHVAHTNLPIPVINSWPWILCYLYQNQQGAVHSFGLFFIKKKKFKLQTRN